MNIFLVSNVFEKPVDKSTLPDPLQTLSARECGTCHEDFYREWRTTIHSQAWTDPYFQTDWRFDGSQQICRNCHTPLDRQQPHVILGFRDKDKWDPNMEPNPRFDPSLQQEGVTEQQARDRGIEPTVLHFPFRDIDRALAEVEPHGMTKFITHKGRLLGATVLGPHAGELIHEVVLAMKSGIKIGELSATIHAYPTLAQIHRRTVNTLYGKKLFSAATRGLVRWINRLIP